MMSSWFLLASLAFYATVLAQHTTVTIGDFNGFSQQHECVQTCLGDAEGFDLGGALQCDQPYVNGCYCASTAAAAASSYLTSCVNSRCLTGDLPSDVTSVVSIYDYYCLTAGYTLPGFTPASAQTTMASTVGNRLVNNPIRIDPGSILDWITRIRIGLARSIQD
jgi:hypothetical protein